MKLTTNVQETIDVLKSGGVVVYPTETSYGLGCDATNAEAIVRIFAMKGRPIKKGCSMLLPIGKMPNDYGVEFPEVLRDLANKHWPGPLTIACKLSGKTPLSSPCFMPGERAFRRSSHLIANQLADGLGLPLLATSANISGEPDQYRAQAIFDRYMQQTLRPDLVFDAGEIPKTAPSTLVKLGDDGTVVVLRQGEIQIV